MINNKKNAFILILILAVSVVGLMAAKHNKVEDRLPIALKAIQLKDGWGYEIDVDGKAFIRQVTVPAIEGYKAFETKDQALTVGRCAVAKLKNGKMPRITISDLQHSGVVSSSN